MSEAETDHYIPKGKWEFDAGVTEVFGDMLRRSIPGYEEMRRWTTLLALRYLEEGTSLLDLGCSKGGAIIPIAEGLAGTRLEGRVALRGWEVSTPMREWCEEHIHFPDFQVEDRDLREEQLFEGWESPVCSCILGVLVLQFVPIEYRQRILKQCFEHLREGGCFILVEKVLGSDGFMQEELVDAYLGVKSASGYSDEEISEKRKSLEGVLVSVTARENEAMLKDAGFVHVEPFWRALNFAGWVAVKG